MGKWGHVAQVCVAVSAILTIAQAPAQAENQGAAQEFVFNHEKDSAETDYVELRKGERFQLVISKTYTKCFLYNFKAVKSTDKEKDQKDPTYPDSYNFTPIVHDGEDRDYLVFIIKNPKAPVYCTKIRLVERGESNPWTLQVRTFGWEIGFSGGFTVDTLTDPQFSLVPAHRNVTQDDGTIMMEDGFQVISQPNAEDDFELGAAAIIHVFNTNPNSVVWRRWAPVSFGLSVNDTSEVRYFFGTSVRFGEQAFLTGGIVFGSKDRLPGGLVLATNSFTTNANSLQTLPTRTDSAFFIAISYTFLGSKGAFEEALQTTPTGGGAAGGGQEQ